ncbi:MAG: hypothetical protein ACXIUB_10085 [Wenzhouxiangella sp.]
MASRASEAVLRLELPGFKLLCRLDGRHDRRLVRYLNAALLDAQEALAEDAGAAQSLSRSLGEGEVSLEIAADCSAAMLARAVRHVALLQEGDEHQHPAQPARRQPSPAQAPVPLESAPRVDSEPPPVSETVEPDEAPLEAALETPLAAGRSRATEKDVPPFADLAGAVEAVRQSVLAGAREDAASRSWVIVRDVFGLEGAAQSQEAVGKSIGLSKQGVTQNLSRSLERAHADALLAARLKATLRAHSAIFWDFLEETCGGMVGDAELESLPRMLDQALAAPHARELAAWALCFQAGHLGATLAVGERRAALGHWLDEHGQRVGDCRLSARLDGEEIGRVLAGLDSLVDTWRLPQSLEFLSGQMGIKPESLETALSWRGPALKLMVNEGLVCSSRAGAQVQRGHRLALLLAAEHGRQAQGLYDLAAEYVARFPDDVVDSRTVFFAMGDQRGVPHWFMPGATTDWRGLYQDASADERLLDLSAHAKAQGAGEAGAEIEPSGRDGEVLALLERHGPLSPMALGKLAEEELDMQASLVGLVIHQSGRIVRVGPKIFGLPAQRQALLDGGELPASFEDPETLQAAAYGVRTGEQTFLFPVWSKGLEKALRERSEQNADALSLRWGRVIDPGYNCAKIFGEIKASAKLCARKASPEAVLNAALHLAEYGVVSVASLNLLGRSRATVLSADGGSLLTALAALGVIAGDEPWFNAQKPGPLHETAIELLSVARFRTGDFDWQQPEAKAFLARAADTAQGCDWMSAANAAKLLAAIRAG